MRLIIQKGYDAEIYGFCEKNSISRIDDYKEANPFTKNGTDKGRLSAHKVVAGATVGRLQVIIVVHNG